MEYPRSFSPLSLFTSRSLSPLYAYIEIYFQFIEDEGLKMIVVLFINSQMNSVQYQIISINWSLVYPETLFVKSKLKTIFKKI